MPAMRLTPPADTPRLLGEGNDFLHQRLGFVNRIYAIDRYWDQNAMTQT